jgi:hypothetical protein
MRTRIRAWVYEADAGVRDLIVEALESEGIPSEGRPGASAWAGVAPLENSPDPADLVIADLGVFDETGPADCGGLALARRLILGGMAPEDICLIASAWTPMAYHAARMLGLHTFQKPFPVADLIEWAKFRQAAEP